MTAPHPSGALDELKVLDLASGVAGAFCGRLFADYGADVVKIEPPDGFRLRQRGQRDENAPGPLFRWVNANKRGITLDLAQNDDREQLCRLAAAADILIEDFGPEERGDDELVRSVMAACPRLVVVSVTDFGLSGPFSRRRGSNLTLNALSGFSYLNQSDGRPYPEPSEHVYTQAGVVAYVTALAALEARAFTGRGQRLDISVLESAASVLTPALTQHFLGQAPERSLKSLIRCKDGYLFILAVQDRAWEAVRLVLGMDDLADDPRFATVQLRTQNHEAMRQAMEQRAGSLTRREIFAGLSTLRGVAGMALAPHELPDDPHLRERSYFRRAEGAGPDAPRYAGPPFRGKSTPWRLAREAPRRGEHTREVLNEWLGGRAGG